MQKREQLILDDAYHDFDDAIGAEVYERESYDHNRADSIEWARRRCEEVPEIRNVVFDLRRRLRNVVASEFPGEVVPTQLLADDEDPNHFFAMLVQLAETKHSASVRELAMSICERFKSELNLDLHPSLFQAQRAYRQRPSRRAIRLL